MAPRLVIANRGEIARRILRAARARGYEVAVISTAADRASLVRREADAVLETDSFLAIDAIVAACADWGATLVHPGYGFLSENPAFAQAVEARGLGFVGPTPDNMRALGGKESAKAIARQAGVPVLEALLSHELAALAPEHWGPELQARGLTAPFLVKASGGGGGRGMRVVTALPDLPEAIRLAAQEAQAAFGDGTVFVERYLAAPRHIEIQVFGDGRGGGVSLGERECSLQRRHQKVLEEAPSSVVTQSLRDTLGAAALALVRATRYRGAGTVEFLLDGDAFHFLEMNTRLQVEHPVTEWVYGVDLVQAQLELAEGRWPAPLGDPAAPAQARPQGVALEARILAEDPRQGWRPTPGPLTVYREPSAPGIRVDSGVAQGDRINPQFDSMIAKLVVWGPDRPRAVARLSQALADFVILGCTTNLPFLQAISRSGEFLAGAESTAWIGEHLPALNAALLPEPLLGFFTSAAFREALSCAFQGLGRPAPGPAERFNAQHHPHLRIGADSEPEPFRIQPGPEPGRFTVDGPALAQCAGVLQGRSLPLAFCACRLSGSAMALAVLGETLTLQDPLAQLAQPRAASAQTGTLLAPMGGLLVEVRVAAGDRVEPGQLLFVMESMKMQFEVRAPRAATVTAVPVRAGQVLQGPEPLAILA